MALTEQQKAYRRAHYNQNKEVYKQRAKDWKAANPEALAQSRKDTRDSLKIKKKRLKFEYGLSWEDFIELYESQGAACKICRTPLSTVPEEGKKVACVDHHHETGAIRGLLCNPCNRGIGYLKDSPTILRLAAEYLDESTSSS